MALQESGEWIGELITRRSWLFGVAASTVPAIAGLAGAFSQTPATQIVDKFSLADPRVGSDQRAARRSLPQKRISLARGQRRK